LNKWCIQCEEKITEEFKCPNGHFETMFLNNDPKTNDLWISPEAIEQLRMCGSEEATQNVLEDTVTRGNIRSIRSKIDNIYRELEDIEMILNEIYEREKE
jgi:hypothetical protein